MRKLKILLKQLLLLVFLGLAVRPAGACITIICQATCVQYAKSSAAPTQTYNMKSTRFIHAFGDANYPEIYDRLKAQCSGEGEVMMATDEAPQAQVQNLKKVFPPSQACNRVSVPTAEHAFESKAKSSR